jgi:hypothetical protein
MARLAVVALAIMGTASTAVAADRPAYEREYLAKYKELRQRHGVRAPGCNLISDRWHNRCKGKASRAEVAESTDTLRRMLYVPKPAPAPAPVASTGSSASTGTTSTYSAPSAGGPEQFAGCESGGKWNAVNPSSGAYGKYQIMPSTHADLCSDLGWDPSSQTACANRIYETQGSGAWAQCGG